MPQPVGVEVRPMLVLYCFFFFFNDTATTEIYTLSLHDALSILFKPSPIRVSRWSWWRRDGLATCSTLMVFCASAIRVILNPSRVQHRLRGGATAAWRL